MVVTVLAVAFLIFIGFIAYIGYRSVIQRAPSAEEQRMEKCEVCRRKFDKTELLLREVGDYRVLYFCRDCIMRMYADIGIRN